MWYFKIFAMPRMSTNTSASLKLFNKFLSLRFSSELGLRIVKRTYIQLGRVCIDDNKTTPCFRAMVKIIKSKLLYNRFASFLNMNGCESIEIKQKISEKSLIIKSNCVQAFFLIICLEERLQCR